MDAELEKAVVGIKTTVEELNNKLENFINLYYPIDVQVEIEYASSISGLTPRLSCSIVRRTVLM